jgi:hypothetical protein
MVLAFAGDSTITREVDRGSDGPSSSTIFAAAPFLARVGFITPVLAAMLLVARFVPVFALAVLAFAI